jgi:iron complex outermembrane receptor protein
MCGTVLLASAIAGGMVSAALAADQPAEQQTAQTAPTPPTPPPPPAANSAPVEEVVVTGQRTRSKVQDVAAPVAEVTGALLEDVHIDSVLNLPAILPSADFHAYNANNVVLEVRGLGAAAVSGGQLGQVGVYVDSMYQGRQNALVYAMHDLETVDLQPGPQNTANGAASVAGLLTVNSAKPTFTPEVIASATLGSFTTHRPEDFGTKQFWGAVSGPVSANDAVRLTTYSDREDGWERNIVRGGTADDSATQGVRFQNLVKKDDVNVLFLASYDNIGQHAGQSFYNSNEIQVAKAPGTLTKYPNLAALPNGAALAAAFPNMTLQQQINAVGALSTVPGFQLPTAGDQTSINQNQNFAGHTSRISVKGDWDLSDHTTLTSISAWQNYLIWPNNDGDWTALDINEQNGSHNWSTQRSEELRLDSKNNQLVDWTAGAFYFHQRNNQISDTKYGADYPLFTALPS